jgi:branched-chain amino acid transport system ATP-binding protein
MLKIESLSLSYGKIEVLHDVSLQVDHKEIVAIVGSNGSGKTTLLRSISGLLPVSSGRISFRDVDITHMRADKLVGMGICQVPEGRHIFPALSVYANLEMGAYVRRGRSARAEFEKNIQFLFELFPILEHRKKQKGGTLSGGEQQMLAMARALMAAPKLLMLDEPSMGIAPLVVKNIFRTIRQLNSQGLTVLMVEQEVEASLSISKRGYALQLGRVVLEGTGQELLANEQVKAIYLGTAK